MNKQILIVKGSPRINGNTSAMADTFAIVSILTNKKFYLLSAGAAPEEKYMQTMINSFHQYISCFRAGGNEEGGILFAYSTNGASDVKTMSVLEKAYQMGKEV